MPLNQVHANKKHCWAIDDEILPFIKPFLQKD